MRTIPMMLCALVTVGSLAVSFGAEDPEEDKLMAKLDDASRTYATARLSESRVGVLSANSHEDLKTGQIGELIRNSNDYTYAVNQVIDDQNMLIYGSKIWIEGVNTKDIVDDSTISLEGIVFEVKGTKRYTAVTGASRTVRHLAVFDTAAADKVIDQILELRRARGVEVKKARDEFKKAYRDWKDSTGKHSIRATFAKYADGTVYLTREDGKEISLAIAKLSKADQTWVRNEIKRNRESESDVVEKKRAKSPK